MAPRLVLRPVGHVRLVAKLAARSGRLKPGAFGECPGAFFILDSSRRTIGRVVEETFGRYRLLEPLGRGEMAEVFKAKSFGVEGFEKILVVKRLLPELAAHPSVVDLFVNEAKLAVRLSHANVVQVFDLGRVEQSGSSRYFMAMEYVAGIDLGRLLARCQFARAPLPANLAIYIAGEIAKGLDHAHRRRDEQMRPLGIVHGDLCPANVLLSWEGEVKLTDFGIARMRRALETARAAVTGAISGGEGAREARGARAHVAVKSAHLSPEQARGEPIDARSDLFSFGLLLFEMLCGAHPCDGLSDSAGIDRLMRADLPFDRLEEHGVAADVIDFLRKALAPSPDDRFGDAAQVYEELLAIAYGQGSRASSTDLAGFLAPIRASIRAPSTRPPPALADSGPEESQRGFADKAPPRARSSVSIPRPSVSPTARRAASYGRPTDLPEGPANSSARRLETSRRTNEPARSVRPTVPPSVPGGRLIGRRQELRRMGELLSAASRRKAQVALIIGSRGIGKSRLLHDVARRLGSAEPTVPFYIASCPPYGRVLPLSGVTAMLHTLCGVHESLSSDRVAAIEPRLRALGLHDEEVNAVLWHLGATARGGASRVALRAALVRMVASLCEDRLHGFAWDDAHALDDESLVTIEEALGRLPAARALFVFSSRDADRIRLLCPASSVIRLGELDEIEAAELVADKLGGVEPSVSLVRFFAERAGGHPLFVEELSRLLLRSGAVRVDDGRITRMELGGEVAAPRPLRSLVIARLSQLDPAARAVVQALAVAGDPADTSTLGQMLGASASEIERRVAAMSDGDLVHMSEGTTVAFYSPFVRDIALEGTPGATYRSFHAAAAAAYESVEAPRSIDQLDRLSFHAAEAGDHERAAWFLASAGERRLEARQYHGAVRDLGRSLAMTGTAIREPTEAARRLSLLSSAAEREGALGIDLDFLTTLVAAVEPRVDRATRVRMRVDLARLAAARHRFEQAEIELERARTLAGDEPLLTRASLLAEAGIARRRGDLRRAARRFDELSACTDIGKPERHGVLLGIGIAHALRGERHQAMRVLGQASQLARADDMPAASERARALVLVLMLLGDLGAAATACEDAIKIAQAAGLSYETASTLRDLAHVHLWLGQDALAYAALGQYRTLAEEIGDERLIAHGRALSDYLDAAHDRAAARKKLTEFVSWAVDRGYDIDHLDGLWLLASIEQSIGRGGEAHATLHRCRELADHLGQMPVVRACDARLSELESVNG